MLPQSVHSPEALDEGSTAAIDDQEDVLSDRVSNLSEAVVEDAVTGIDNQEHILDSQESYSLNEEHSNLPPTAAKSSTNQRPSITESLSYSGLFGVIGGTLFILGLFGFLTFLWFGHGFDPEAADSTSLWRFIALNDYFARTITICSVALRLAVSIQAAICTSMIAALVLEKYGAQKHQVAWFSIIRSLNDGPIKLGGLLLSARPRSTLLHIESWLAFLLIIVTLALQFSSTLLLSDFNSFVIIGDPNNTKFGDIFRYDEKVDTLYINFSPAQFIQQRPVNAAFGEAQAGFDATPNHNGVSDTGLVQRSLIPVLEADVRQSVRKVEGTTMVMSSRSSCIRPRINAEYYTKNALGKIFRNIAGTVNYDASFESAGVTSGSLCNDLGCEALKFDCAIPNLAIPDSGWQTAACIIDDFKSKGWTNFIIDWDPADGPWSKNATIMLVITTNNTYSQDWTGVTSETLPAGNPYQEWQSYRMGSQNFFNITLCSIGFGIDRFRTSMVAAGPLHEPQAQLSPTSLNTSHSTTDIQALMGVQIPQRSHADRRILDLEILGAPEDPPGSPASAPAGIQGLEGTIPVGKLTTTVLEIVIMFQYVVNTGSLVLELCYFCSIPLSYKAHSEIGLLFSDTVAETGRAANAILSLMTTLFTSVYYEFLGSLEEPSSARLVATKTVQTPGPCSTNGCRGYIAVSTLILTHLICVIIITALYVTQVQHSRYGNVWHTIAQLSGDDIADVLREAHDSSDAAVERALKSHHDNQHLKIGKQEKTGRVEVIVDQ
ncbi:hypothetical protein F4679DRAFT_599031 [Xylaria curta]|nr:hypothetical protein F4679DRAFT_599031 [Xylaria curta]